MEVPDVALCICTIRQGNKNQAVTYVEHGRKPKSTEKF